jgi:hypothetical protein
MSLIDLALGAVRILVCCLLFLMSFVVVVVGLLLTRLVKLADHVDILGRMSLNDLILQVAGGRGELINETIHSNIREYAEKVKIYEEEA